MVARGVLRPGESSARLEAARGPRPRLRPTAGRPQQARVSTDCPDSGHGGRALLLLTSSPFPRERRQHQLLQNTRPSQLLSHRR